MLPLESLRFDPTKCTTEGFGAFASASRTLSATGFAGGFEMTTMTFVFGSLASMSMAKSVVSAPTFSLRSRPPVPIAWEMPNPAFSTRQVTSWVPVPEAPTTPMGPRRTLLAKPSMTP